MSGKSALLRQTALIVLMAQIGSYVPAKASKTGIVDKIFTRVGASDNISLGESTFMVEMNETASILNNLSDRSLILLDEIGRDFDERTPGIFGESAPLVKSAPLGDFRGIGIHVRDSHGTSRRTGSPATLNVNAHNVH